MEPVSRYVGTEQVKVIAFGGSRYVLTVNSQQVLASIDAMSGNRFSMINLNFAAPEIAMSMCQTKEFIVKVRRPNTLLHDYAVSHSGCQG